MDLIVYSWTEDRISSRCLTTPALGLCSLDMHGLLAKMTIRVTKKIVRFPTTRPYCDACDPKSSLSETTVNLCIVVDPLG